MITINRRTRRRASAIFDAIVHYGTQPLTYLCLLSLGASAVLCFILGSNGVGLSIANFFMGSHALPDILNLTTVQGPFLGHKIDNQTAGSGGLLEPPVIFAYGGTTDIPDLESMKIRLPLQLENYQDWTVPFSASNRMETPVLWTIPRAGCGVVTRVLGQCLGLVQVSGKGYMHDEAVSVAFFFSIVH